MGESSPRVSRLSIARKTTFIQCVILLLTTSLSLLMLQRPAYAHKDPETSASITGTANETFEALVPLDGKRFLNPSFRVVLQDNAPDRYWHSTGTTSVSAYLEMDLTLAPFGYCPSWPTGPIDIQKRDLAADLTPLTNWETTNSIDKQGVCTRASVNETWHFGRDSIGFVAEAARTFEVRLVDRASGAVYLRAIGPGEFVTPRSPSELGITSTTASSISLRWYDNSSWENHMELQRAGEPGTPWNTIARVRKTDGRRGWVYRQDFVPFSSTTMYRYRVRAVSGDRASEWTPVIVTSVPLTPSAFAAAPAPRAVTLSWSDTFGEAHYEIERSQDGFATVQTMWNVAPNATTLVDETSEGIETYQYRIRAVNEGGASAWSTLELTTPGLLEPPIQEFYDTNAMLCGEVETTSAALACTYGQMYEFHIHTAEVRICTYYDGAPAYCQKYLLAAPENPPSLPDDDDPSVPPSIRPDGTPWVPPSAPGELEWEWGGSVADFPTKNGSWHRACLEGTKPSEYLHWDNPHAVGKPSHWGYKDCFGKVWEMPLEWLEYGRAWYPENSWF